MPGPIKQPISGPDLVRRAGVKDAKAQHEGMSVLGKYAKGTFGGLYAGITGAPTGAYMTGRSVAHDIGAASHGDFSFDRTRSLGTAIGKAEYNSWRHLGQNHDFSGPILDALAVVTAGGGAVARGSKALEAVSQTAKDARSLRAVELARKDAGVFMAKGGGGVPGIGYTKAAEKLGVKPSELKTHARIYKDGLEEGNMSVGKPAGVQGKFANHPPHQVLKDTKHPLYDFYAERNPEKISNTYRAKSAFMIKPQYSRKLLTGKPLNKKSSGVTVPTSPNPLFRQVRKGVEQIRPAKSASRELKKEAIRRDMLAERINAPVGMRVKARINTPQESNVLGRAIGVPMSALRMSMWARPRYYMQNIAQTGQMLGSEPILTARSAKLAGNLFKENRDLYNQVRAVTGDAQAGAIAAGTSPSWLSGKLGPKLPGKVGKTVTEHGFQGAMGHAANIPESHVRMLSVLNELQKHHENMGLGSELNAGHIEKYFNNLRRQGILAKEHLPLRRSVENVGDFGRIYSKNMLKQKHMSEKDFMATQIPIFYPMFKAMSRYGVRLGSEHPSQLAATVAAGKAGKKEQNRLLGPLPFWAQYLIPKGAGDPNAKRSPRQAVLNPANVYNLQPVTDIGKQVTQMGRIGGPVPGLSLLQEAGPAPGIAYGALTGHDIQTGYPIKPFSKQTYKAHPGLNRSLINTAVDFAESLPLSDFGLMATGQSPHVRSFAAGTAKDRILQELFGPSVIPRILKTKETTKQAKREQRVGMGRKPKKKAPGY